MHAHTHTHISPLQYFCQVTAQEWKWYVIDTRKQRPGGAKCKVLLRKTSIMGHGLWSKGTTEFPSPPHILHIKACLRGKCGLLSPSQWRHRCSTSAPYTGTELQEKAVDRAAAQHQGVHVRVLAWSSTRRATLKSEPNCFTRCFTNTGSIKGPKVTDHHLSLPPNAFWKTRCNYT